MNKMFLLPFILLSCASHQKEIITTVEPILELPIAIVDTTSTVNVFPNGKTIVADHPLPLAVYQNQKSKIIIDAFTDKKASSATGILIQPGKIITVKHILNNLDINKDPTLVKEWRGTIVTPTEFKQFKLKFVLSGEKETLEDILLLEIDDETALNDSLTISADSIFVGQTVYVSTLKTTTYKIQPVKNWFPLNLPIEIINYTFQTKILSVINEPYIIDDFFVKLFKPLFRIKLNLPNGCSGSPVFDEYGNLIGMVIATDKTNFSFVLSAIAIKEFVGQY